MRKKNFIGCYCDDALKERLSAQAKRDMISEADVIRRSVNEYCARREQGAEQKTPFDKED